MNTRRTTSIRVREDIAIAGATPQGNKIPPEVQATANNQVLVNPSAMTDGEVMAAPLQMAQSITTQAKILGQKLTEG